MKPPGQLRQERIRTRNCGHLAAVRKKNLCKIPGGAVASDRFRRQYDLTLDFCENVAVLELDVIDCIASMMEDADMTARIGLIISTAGAATTAKLYRPAAASALLHHVPAWRNGAGFAELTQHLPEP